MITQNRNPVYNHNINPIYNHNINPIYNHNINPIYNHNINPVYNHNINHIYNHNINPIFNRNFNPIYNHDINPIYNHNINPIYNHSINPIFNNSILGFYIFNKSQQPIEFVVSVTPDFFQIFNYTTNQNTKFGIKHSLKGFVIFQNITYIGHAEDDNQNGFVLFDVSNQWTGTIK